MSSECSPNHYFGALTMTKRKDKHPIGALRDSALSMQVGSKEEGPVVLMIDMGSTVYAVKARAIYDVQLADQIDPKRTNAAVPNTQQRLLPMGAENPEVARIFLTAHTLFKSVHLGSDFDEKKAVSLAFELLQMIAAMMDMRVSLADTVQRTIADLKEINQRDRSFRLPSLGNAEARCHAFAQKVGHAIDTLERIARLFYPNDLSSKWIDSLTKLAEQKYGSEAPLPRFMKEIRPSLLFMREMRNKIEHPNDNAYVKVNDFRLLPTLELDPPSVEIVDGSARADSSLTSFMGKITDEFVDMAELMIALLVGANVQPFTGFELMVVELPPDRRPQWNPHQRMSYGIVMNGDIHPLG